MCLCASVCVFVCVCVNVLSRLLSSLLSVWNVSLDRRLLHPWTSDVPDQVDVSQQVALMADTSAWFVFNMVSVFVCECVLVVCCC